MTSKNSEQWKRISAEYRQERESASFNSLLLDPLLKQLLPEQLANLTALDIGAGIGTYTRMLAAAGCQITAVEPNKDMRKEFTRCSPDSETGVSLVESLECIKGQSFDIILAMNVLDHVKDIAHMLDTAVNLAAPHATFIISIPHPFKDLGEWFKECDGDALSYRWFRVDGYFSEGTCLKNR